MPVWPILFQLRLVPWDALLSPTRPLNWCLGRSLLCSSEDSLDPDLCGLKTNRVNIFLAASIPGLNISKHVKLTFLRHSRQGSRRLRLPGNRVNLSWEGLRPRAGGAGAAARAECHAAGQLCLATGARAGAGVLSASSTHTVYRCSVRCPLPEPQDPPFPFS